MEKIQKKEVEKADEKKKSQSATRQIAVVAIIMLVMVGTSILVYNSFILPKREVAPEQVKFNNFVFTKKGVIWETEVQFQDKVVTLPVHYTPHEVRNVYIGGILNESFNQGPLYITIDPTEKNITYLALATAELSINLAQGVGRQLVAACALNETQACEARPIIDCDSDVAVIYLKYDPTPFVKFEDNCIVITGENEDLVKAVDKLLYFWYGIIKNQEGIQDWAK